MNILRSHLLPHAIFVILFIGVVVGSAVSLNRSFREMYRLTEVQRTLILLLDPRQITTKGSGQVSLSGILKLRSLLDQFQETVKELNNTMIFLAIGGEDERFNQKEISEIEKRVASSFKLLFDHFNYLKFHAQVIQNKQLFFNFENLLLSVQEAIEPPTTPSTKMKMWARFEQIDIYNKFLFMRQHIDQIQTTILQELAQNTEELSHVYEFLAKTVLVSFLILVSLSLIYFITVSTLLARPLRQLAEVAKMVTAGRLLIRAKIDTGGPVGDLVKDFNRMVDMLVKSLKEKEEMVEKLHEKTKELAAANEHKNRFIAHISHELKTPLNAIIGFTDILLLSANKHLTKKEINYLQRIKRAGNHLLAMICDLIDLVKLDLHALELRTQPTDLNKFIEETAQLMRPQIQQKSLQFTMNLPTHSWILTIDPVRIRQILLNLLSNAIKFTPEQGKVSLSVSITSQENQPFYHLIIEVSDTGIGISKEDQKRIFEDFVQVDNRLQRKHEGAGIGLALTKRLVKLMNGKIVVKSELNKGSIFTVTIPLSEEQCSLTNLSPSS